MPSYLVTNPTKAQRTILLSGASHVLAPGESKPIELPDNIAEDERTAGMEVSAVEAPSGDASEPEGEGDNFDAMTEDELRDFIEDNTGERPHPRTGRAKLLAAAREV